MIVKILAKIKDKKNILIVSHNDPDPDTLSAAFAMQCLLKKLTKKDADITYKGNISRTENIELVKQCGIELKKSEDTDFSKYDFTIVVDAQPESGNMYLPEKHKVDVIIDHHIFKEETRKIKNVIIDVREDYGSTCTIVAEYYKKFEIIPDENVATAMCVGISTDTIGNARDSNTIDAEMLGYLYPKVSLNKMSLINTPELPLIHYTTFHKAIINTEICGQIAICDLKKLPHSELVAEVADYLLRMQNLDWVLVSGEVGDQASFSIRHKNNTESAGHIAIEITKGIGFGGGHVKYAGGQIPLADKNGKTSPKSYDEVYSIMRKRFIDRVGLKESSFKKLLEM